jgi:hypothetical protein
MYRSKLITKRAVNETTAIGIAAKHQVPLLMRSEMSAQGLPSFAGGGNALSVVPVLIQDDHGVVPGIQLQSKDGWTCVLDQWAIDDLVTAFSTLKPKLELMNADLGPSGFLI